MANRSFPAPHKHAGIRSRVCPTCGYVVNTDRLGCPACTSPLPPLSAKVRKRPAHPEDNHQAAIFTWAALNEKRCPELRMLHATPNGGQRNKREAGRLKAQGVKAGYPDFGLDVPRAPWAGLRIELKATHAELGRKPQVSPEQARWIEDLQHFGYKAGVCEGAQAAITAICDYLGIKP